MFKFAFYLKVIFIISIFALTTGCSSSSSDNTNTNVNAAVINFSEGIIVDSNSAGPQEILLGDVDNDGDLDIVAIYQGKANVVYINNDIFNGGRFVATDIDPVNALTNQPLSGDLGDIDGDTYLDLVAANQGGPNYAYINDGSGGFSSRIIIQADSDTTRTVKLADLDKNNTLDLYAGNAGSNKVYINDGLGNFLPGADIGSNVDDTWAIKFADFNMNDSEDMLAGNPAGTLCLHINNGTGLLSTCDPVAGPGESGSVLAIGDVDGDLDVDIIFDNNADSSQLYLNDGTGRFTYQDGITSGAGFISAAALGDLDGDNDIDYITGTTGMPVGSGTKFPYIHLNNGSGEFDTGMQFGSNGDDTPAIALGDIDSDGDLDIVMGKLNSPMLVYENLN